MVHTFGARLQSQDRSRLEMDSVVEVFKAHWLEGQITLDSGNAIADDHM